MHQLSAILPLHPEVERQDWEKVKGGEVRSTSVPPSRAHDPTETWCENLQTAIQKKQNLAFQNNHAY